MKKTSLTLSLLLSTLGTAGCSPDPRLEPTDQMKGVVEGNNAFSWDMYKELQQLEQGNQFCSPLSITMALSMLYAGAEGNSQAQLEAALSIAPGTEQAWHANLGALMNDLTGDHNRPYTLYSANRLWLQQDRPFEEAFLTTLEETYLASAGEADFTSDPDAVRKEINRWVSDQTKDRIPELFEEGSLSQETRLVLANAIYFKAEWDELFEKDLTSPRDFYLSDGTTVSASTMEATKELRLAQLEDFDLVVLPYKGGEVSLVVLLPRALDGLPALLEGLDDSSFASAMSQAVSTEVQVRMPRFEFSYTMPIKDTLLALGVTDVFDPDAADLSGILDPSVEQLFVSSVVHKAYVRVDEEGTEAAAATGLSVDSLTSAMTPAQMQIDHPFLALIYDEVSDAILFMGTITDPTQAQIQN